MKKRFALHGFTFLLVVALTACSSGGLTSEEVAAPKENEQATPVYELNEDALAFPSEPEPEFGENKLEVEYVGRHHILEGDPDWESAFDLIKVESFDATAKAREGPNNLFDFNLLISNSGRTNHEVVFSVTFQVPAEDDPRVNENARPTAIGGNTIVPIEPGDNQVGIALHAAFLPLSQPTEYVDVVSVEITEIDYKVRDEYLPPEPTDEYYRDVWVLSNPTSQAFPVFLDYRKRDGQGVLLESGELGICGGSVSSWTTVFDNFSILPPSESIVIHDDLTIEEVEEGVVNELTVLPLTSCSSVNFYAGYDPQLEIIDVQQHGTQITVVVENFGHNEGVGGVLYLNVYDSAGEPIYGNEARHKWPDFLRIPPGEKVEMAFQIPKFQYIQPKASEYEMVFLGLSRNE